MSGLWRHPSDAWLHKIVERQARRTPLSYAIEWHRQGEEEPLLTTYADLKIQADQLAQGLREFLHATPTTTIAVCLPKSPHLYVAILAVLSLGHTWTPIDPAAPKARKVELLRALGTCLLYIDDELLDFTPPSAVLQVVSSIQSDSIARGHLGEHESDAGELLAASSCDASTPCHILWTSGSTGSPKGVVISHIAVANNIAALSRLFGLDMTVRTLQFAHFTFDVFALDVFMTWGAGGCLVAGDHSEILLDLSSFIRRREITYAQLTPSVIHMLDPLQVGPSLRVLASSGEAMTQSIVHAWASRTELYNCYGPTETDVVTAHRVTDQCSPLNIGAPTEGMTVLLLDDCGKQVGTGVEGEICVQGPQVMLRYLNSLESPDDWHCMDLAGRYYRTRDFGRMESTGDITFVGRRDHQVKIRGHRVNLAEIENVLQRDPDVAYAICLFPTAGSFQAHLCAFIQRSAKALLSANHDAAFEPAPMKEASTIISRAHDVLRGVLPAAMLPTQWWCGMLPVTTSGKIDRQRLISWVEQDAAHAQAHRVLPGRPLTLDESSKVDESSKGKGTSTLENTIRVVWGSLLDIPPAQIPSDLTFYAAGGHSILAIRLIATLRSHGISMTLAELRAANTIEEQVRFAHQSVGSAIASNKLNPHRPFDLLESCDASFVETVAKSCSTTPEVVADVYPCTAMQKGLMAASLQNPGRYICHFRFQSQRGFDTAEFKEAWSALVASEPILRTRIVSEQGSGMLQVVLTSESGALSMSPKGFARNNRWLGSPLWSLHANSTSTWDLYIHHVLLDGWQSQLLLHKMNSLLSSHSRIPPLLSDGSRAHGQQGSSFADFICHLQRVPPAEPSHVFWTRMLADATPSDVPPKPAGVDLCSVESLCLSSAITLDYRGIAARCSVPPGIILSTIWTLVYSGLASESHVTYGTILSGRDTPVKGIEDIFGPTFAVVPFVCELDSAASFEDLLHLHDRTYTDIAPHQHFGLQNIRRLNANCLEICSFRVLFVIQPELEEPLEDHAIRLEAETQPSYEYPLVMTFTMQKGNRFQVQAHSWPNAIRPEEVQCVLDQIAEVAQKISKDGIAQSLRQLGTASDAQAKRMLANSSTPTAHDITIPEIFLGSASLSPDAMALYDQASDVSLTYQTVDVLSAALAAELKSRGARHEEIVPICMEKSAAAIVAMLGIHRAGCAYVPVDPTHPLQRRISLLQRVGAKIVICGRDYRDDYSTVVNEMIVAETSDVQSDDSWSSLSPPSSASNLDDSAPNIGSSHTGPTSNGTLPASDSPAFVLYTSGSTGEPKGVVLTHRNIATAIHHLAESFRLRPGIRTLQFSAFTFDMSLMEIYMAWLCGGCVCVPSPHARMNELSKSLRSMRIDTVVATSTVASLLRLEDAPYLETMIISGERLTMAIAEKWSDVVHLYQCYGPTESGISVTSIRVPAGSIDLANIGPPISARVWIVDEECAVLPPGYLGEIAISGPTVARGYFNNDDLTKNRFVNIQVIKDAPPERVYLTGDIGRLDGHGHIRIQGRRDFQVKIHGIRVELGEIEDKVLETDRAAISQVVVTYTAGRLIAFIRLDSAYREVREGSMACRVEPIVERINGHLQSILPNYMIPSRYIFVDEFPKTSSGKIDRRQLELSAHQDDSRHLEQEPERISIPPSLKDLLEKVLDIRDGRTLVASDSFFDLGGDSFSAIRLVAAARDAGYTITVQQIFATPRIDAIWAHMSRDTQGPTRDATSFPSTAFALKDFLNGDDIRAATGLERHQIEDVYPCTPFQEGIAALTIASPDLYVARHVFKAVGCEANRLEKAVRLIIEQTPMLRTAIVTTSTLGTLQVVASSDVALKSCLATSHRPLRSLLAESPQIGHPYLCNVQIVSDEASSQCHISLTMSHAMYDGWSHDLLLADILTAYEKGTFQAPDVSFQHFVAFQYAEQSSPEHRDWWKDYLHDSSAASYPDPPPSDTTGSLIADQLQSGQNCIQWPGSVSKTALLHAAWTLILSLYENVTEPCYATVFAGRDVDFPGIETVRGPTMSAAVCRLPFDPQHRILAYLRQIERTLADMRSHVLIGLQNIRNIDDHTAQACDVRTMLVVQPEARCDPLADNAGIQFELVDDRMSHGYPLTMECEPRRDSVTTRLYFDEAWISAEQAARITGQFVFLVGELCKGVELDLCIEEMTVVPAGDLEKIQEWNHIQLSSVEENVYGLIRRSVHAMHDRPAIECTFSPTISYFELDGLVCNLAGQLRARGLCSREKVLVQMAKSPQQIIAILAVLSVGATFVPVDLEWPPERAQRVAVTSEASWILVDSNSMLQAALLPTNINVVTITAKALQDRSPASEAPASSDIHPEDTAYILFTSGSTGEPKGICTPHSAACTAVLAIVKDCGISPKSRVLAFSSLTFDASILEIFGTLFAGGVICLPSERERLYGLEDTICTLQSNWLGLTPGVASTISPDKVPGVQSLMLFGESIPQTLVEAWYPHVRVIFGYGPTETTIAVTAHHDSRDPYCIGKAIGSTTTWVVDPRNHHRLMPIGAVGELVCIGPTIATGYVNDPERTEVSFLQPPRWANEESQKWRAYRTGDLVRYYPDGSIRILGRADGQVKIRGKRVELSEIDAIVQNTGLTSGVATEVLQTGHAPRLVCFIVVRGDVTMGADRASSDVRLAMDQQNLIRALKLRLEESLPSYMQPWPIFAIDRLPRGSSGKVDRRLLRQLAERWMRDVEDESEKVDQSLSTLDMGSHEQMLRDIWADVLQIDRAQISCRDNFTRLGGDSLSSMRVVARLRSKGYTIHSNKLHHNMELSGMAALLEISEPQANMVKSLAPFSQLTNHLVNDLQLRITETYDLSPDGVVDIYPLTPTQIALLAASLAKPGAYMNRIYIRLPDHTPVERIERALEEVVKCHEMLRTVMLPNFGESGVQAILRNGNRLVERLGSAQEIPPCEIGALPRFSLVPSNEGVRLIASIHHAAMDASSVHMLSADLRSALLGHKLAERPPFSRFVQHVTKTYTDGLWRAAWSEYLDRQLPSIYPPKSDLESREDPGTLRREIKIPPTHQHFWTVADLINIALAIVLRKMSNASSVCYGVALSGRTEPVAAIAEIAGPTFATIPIISDCDDDCSIEEMLRAHQDGMRRTLPYQQVGLSAIASLNECGRQASSFTTLLIIHPAAEPDVYEQNEVLVESESKDPAFPLEFECRLTSDTVQINLAYDGTSVVHAEAQWLLEHFSHVLEWELATKDLSSLTLEQTRMHTSRDIEQLDAWNSIRVIPEETTLQEMFDSVAQGQADNVAIEAPDGNFTYSELDQLSSALAMQISKVMDQKIGYIPLMFEKSAASIIAIMGILKAGSAYVPLDPGQPEARLKAIQNDIDGDVIVCSASMEAKCALWTRKIVFDLNDFAHSTQTLFPLTRPAPSSTAYIMFTSGSTGKPKGVIIPHRAVCTSVRDQIRKFEFCSGRRILHFCAYTFDVSVMEIFATLCAGATLIIPSEAERTVGLASFIQSKMVHVAVLTATAVRNFLHSTSVPHLQQLILVGEPITANLIQQFHDQVQLINDYGPTETTIDSATNITITSATKPTDVGHPISSHLWIVERKDPGQLCAVGVPGQLVISGPTLADGYLNNPGQTRQAFLKGSDLAWTAQMSLPPDRLYQTGDLARFGPNGEVHILGRLDTQIKLNGLRIEIRDVESVMESFNPVITVAVALSKPCDGAETLVGVIANEEVVTGTPSIIEQPSEETMSLIDDLRGHLVQCLPSYMVPTRIFCINRLPVNISGKLDRIALSRILASMDDSTRDRYSTAASQAISQAPVVVTEAELELSEIWAQVLDIDQSRIGPKSSFFGLGGDSLLAIKLSSVLSQKGKSISLQEIFKTPKLREMAKRLPREAGPSQTTGIPTGILQPTVLQKSKGLMDEVANACQVLPQQIEQVYPCTPLQENLFVASLLSPETYQACISYELGTSINLDKFCASWEAVYQRHAILRTRLVACDDNLDRTFQVIVQDRIAWHHHERLSDCRTPPVVVSGAALTQWNIVEQEDSVRRFVLHCHHSLYDDLTLRWILADFREIYSNGFIDDPPPLDMGCYVGFLQAKDSTRSREIWQEILSQPVHHHFPRGKQNKRQPLTDAVAAERQVDMDAGLNWKTNLTPLVRAAWILTVARNQAEAPLDQENVAFGTVISGRSGDWNLLSRVSGPLICTIPVVEEVRADESLSTLLDRIRAQHIVVMGHEHVGMQRGLDASTAKPGGFRNMLVIQSPSQDGDGTDHRTSEIPDLIPVHSELRHPCALVMECVVNAGGINISAGYDSQEVDEKAVELIMEQFSSVLSWLSKHFSDPRLRVSDALDTLSTSLQSDLVLSWNPPPEPAEHLLHARFCSIARSLPTRQAVYAADRQLTYQQLARESMLLAQVLIDGGVHAGCTVPICFEKGSFMIVAQLAVLRAGGAYVPIAPDHPQSRRELIRRSCNTRLCLVSTLTCHLFAQNDGSITVDHDYLERLSLSRSSELEYPSSYVHVQPRSPAYVLYTSGSTGVPKGVQVSHGAISLSVIKHAMRFGHSQHTGLRSLQFCNYTFDVSLMDIFATLSFGGCVCVPSEDDRFGDLSSFIVRSRAELAMLTPTVANMLSPAQVPSLLSLVVGGEPMTSSVIEKWTSSKNMPLRTLHNVYGPTEASVNVATCLVGPQSLPSVIGRPMLGSSLFITEPHDTDRLAPVGCVGELIIAGPCLADGYVDQPDQTAKAFIPAPSWLPNGWGNRVYRTGDLARFSSDGQIMCLGRIDTQVKLHGVRIELSEIEAIACGVPGVLTAAGAVARRHGKEQLALLCELQNEQDDSLNLVRAHMARFLPPNMVPSILMSGPIQLTSTGKIDRKALFKRFEAAQEESVAETAWSSEHMANAFERENEQNLQQIWARVLGCRSGDIFASSDFFELGADSLDVIKLVGNLQRAGHKISYRDVYTNSTFDRMVKWLETCHGQGPASASRSPLPFELLDTTSLSQPKTVAYAADTLQVESGSIVDMYPCAHMQSSLITASLLMPDAYWFRVQVELAAEMDGSRVTSAWNQVVQRHPIMRTVIVNHHVLGDMQVVLDMDPLRALPDQSTRENGVLGRPLHKLSVFPPDDLIISYLVLEMHHVIYDRWVSDALMADLASILQYGSSTRPCLPFNRLIQYQQQRSVTSSDYWKNCLAGASITTFVSPAINASRQLNTLMTSCLEWKIPLRSPSTGHPKVSVATIVHCAYAMVVSCYSGSSDVCFPTIQSGRNIPLENVDQIIGPTMTSILFRTDCSGNIKVGEFLQTAQDYLLRACDHQQVPTRVLREALGVSGPLDMSCMLVVQPHSDDTADREPGADGFTFRHAEMHQPGSVLVEAIVGPGAETSLCLRYAPEILDESQAELLLSHLCNAITRLASCEGQERLQDMSVLSTLDDEIIARSCGATAPGSDGTTVTHMFRQAAARWPKAIAVDAHDCSLTFERLLYLAEQLAGKISATAALSQHSYLNPIGETSSSARGGEIRVAACASRGALAVLMQVATFLMPNTAFIPLDQGSPPERNAQILNDVEPDIILCSPETETCVRATTALMSSEKGDRSPTLVVLDLDTLVQFDPISSKQLSYAQPDHIAYILYTSGSSGAPKGVRMDHDPLATTIKALTDKKRVLQGARVLWSSPWTFDSHLSQVWEALTVGGTVCVPHETALHRNTEQTLASWTINHAFFTPNMAAQVDFLSLGIPQTLRTLAMGGEVIGFDVRPLLRAGICIVNEYGPSECAICVTAHVLKEHDQSSNNIGSPLPGNSCWVVQGDDPSRLAPVGTVGELAVGGTLARGYLNRPAQSAASFIAAPQWAMHATRRLYLTGDLVRLDTHGRFHYIGRKDSQIKINGVRIEVGEIEHRLAAIDPSTSVLVAAIDRNSQASGESGKSEIRRPNIVLVAFLGGSAVQGALAESEQLEIVRTKAPMLRARLAEIMPRTMLPRIWIPLAHPPQTRTGKVDRKALHVIFHDHMERHEETTSAATGITENVSLSPSERTMQALWADVLKCDLSTIGPMCDFFELGDSLHAIALVSAASRAGFALTAVQIFERPMLRDMALLLHQSEGEPIQHSRIVECDPAPFSLLPAEQSVSAKSLLSTRLLDVAEVEDVYKLTPCQMVSFLGNQKPHSSYYAWFLLKISGPLDAARLRLSCEETVHDHAILRTVFFAFEDSWYQAPVSGVPLNFLSLQWSGSRESVPDLLGSTSSNIGASFQCPTVFRLLQASKEKQLLAIGLSHAQYDGISISSIFDEIVTRYKANYFPPCPRPAFSRLLEYSDIQAPSSKAFWRKTLAGADMAKVYNRKSPSVQNASRDLLDTTVTRTISYRSSSVPKGTTFHDVLTLAWAVTLGSATGSNDVVFGSLSSGRNAAIENIALLPGPCITTVPVRVRLQQHSLHEALQALHSAHVEAMPHEHLGLREIVHHCTEWRSGTRFSTVIQHQNFNLWRGADDRPDSDGSLETGERVQFSNAGSIAYRGACDEVDLWVTTLPVADNEMRLQILFSENNMRSEVAQKLLDVLCHNMKTILSVKQQQEPGRKGYDDLGVLVAQSEAMLDQIRLPLQLPLEITPESAMAASAPLSHQGDDDDNCADTCLELEAESVTLGRIIRRTLHLPASAPLMRTTSLHDLGSDSVSLAVIATHLRQEGFDVSTSDLLRAKSLGQLSRVMSSGWRKRERKNVLQWDEMSDLQI